MVKGTSSSLLMKTVLGISLLVAHLTSLSDSCPGDPAMTVTQLVLLRLRKGSFL
nr:hypothetical protein Iba_chr04bCG20430 [Ipomoea batatas]GMC85172.1 hypothetical protein Iba_chr04cCG18640 [Ipomoea batatas]